MNRLETNYNGGMPLDLDDIRWIDDAVREALKGSSIPWANYYVLTGCAVTTSATKDIAEGYCVIDGEICYVPAHSVAIPGVMADHDWVIQLEETFDSDGLETFENASSNDTYAIRRGKLAYADISKLPSGTLTPYDEYLPADPDATPKSLKYFIAEAIETLIGEYHEDWIAATLDPLWVEHTTVSVHTPGYRKEFGRVWFRGVIRDDGTITGDDLLFTLPTGYRPAENIVIHQISDWDSGDASVRIQPDGEVRYISTGSPSTANISLHQIPPFEPA